MSDVTVQPNHFLTTCRVAVGCDDVSPKRGGLVAGDGERILRALSALESYACGCLWCEMLGDRTDRKPPGPRVLSAACAARVVHDLLGDELARRLMRVAADSQGPSMLATAWWGS